jgi:arabinogalactan oligomer/maltooligosaccharide transport system substrate-binding protein
MKGLAKYSKIRMVLLLTAILAMAVTGCSKSTTAPGKDQPVTITFWHTYNAQETPTMEAIVKDFEKQNPNIKVQMQAVPFAEAQNKFITAGLAGNAPDVFRSECAWSAQFAAMGLLAPLDDLISAQDKKDYFPAAAAYYQYRGKTYGVPQSMDALALMYNKRLLKEAGVKPPKTMEEFVAVAQKLTNSEKGRYGFCMRGDSYWLQPFIWAFGGGLIDQNRNILINSPESVKALQFVVDLKNKYKVTPMDTDFPNDYQNALVGFKTGKYAMILNGPWATADILSGAEFKDPSNLGIEPIPRGPGGKTGSPVGGHGYVISANSKVREAAYKFIEFINSKESQAKFALKNNILPTRRSAYELPEVKNNKLITEFKAVMELATPRPILPEGGQIYNDFTPNFQAAYAGKKTPQQAMDDIAAAWSKLLKK